MSWSAPEISLLVVVWLSALALATMWLGDRSRPYMLWWALAHASLPLIWLLTIRVTEDLQPNHPVNLLLTLSMSVQSVCLVSGVISYRSPQLQPRRVAVAIAALCAVFYLLALLFDVFIARRAATLVTVVALLASATLMWSLGRFERIAAAFFAARGLLALVLPVVMSLDPQGPYQTRYTPSLTVLLAIGAMLALLIAAYQRSLDRLRGQFRALELTQALTNNLQGVSDEIGVAHRSLTVFAERLDWSVALFLGVTEKTETYRPLAHCGVEESYLPIGSELVIPDDSPLGVAVSSQRLCHSTNLPQDQRVPERYRDHPTLALMPSMVAIPVTHDSVTLGVVLLRGNQRRELSEAELQTLESLGQVIGLSLANTRNLSELAHRANHDVLTGLGNRTALHDDIRTALARYPDRRGAVMLFDLDHFKRVNDALGHAVGDQLLQALAERLQRHLAKRPAHLFRLGGDEFVILHRIDEQYDAMATARELAEVIAAPLQIGELSLRTPASIGVAIGPDHGRDSHELLRCADVAMYHAKQHGAGVTLYERDIDAHKLEHLTLLSAVSEGLERDQFELHYQPFVNLATGAITGCEGLIRWRHPTLGLIGAAEFMPLVEATDLIRVITRRVIDIAMRDAARWQQLGIDTRIAINLSAHNILDPELPDYLLDAAAQHGVAPQRLQLEITETILIKDPASAERAMRRLTDAGFTLALDDFGTGYSSLAYLARFPIHTLKIDRSFVRNMLTHTQSRTIVDSTIALARGLGLQVTAEGVEQQAEADLLRQLGCDCAQGYLFSRPQPQGRLIEKLQEGSLAPVA